MKYSLSNTASKTLIREELGIKFKYPNIYKPRLKIDGYKEQSVSIITMEEPNLITQGIWGILPQNFEGEWKKFQRLKTTLHVNEKEISENVLYKEALERRRCLIIVTGFYTHHLEGKKITNYLVEKTPLKPFYLAGIYNVLEDGFATCSVINTNTNSCLSSINNLYEVMPLQIPKMFKNIWLDKATTIKDINYIVSKPYITKFKIQRIAS
ncbi:putative SOS response-associated peptidase YedK [Tenacibaculum adriaticum]|uniref:Abasic site processing protein n=1 Tax=Tenacibaculum adriaticum TaxID=413713 RepID=A0A5S5DVL6_9FLAO|nr:SOS response-associated peptidase family protein [Tenacibaculum adriaticum]TYP99318.1 putative SOS response-associated peptidase YedK [Tenacibaculum adriaticum]